jgi:hypothetical protein
MTRHAAWDVDEKVLVDPAELRESMARQHRRDRRVAGLVFWVAVAALVAVLALAEMGFSP